jgi:hypothetical protein
MQILSAVNLIVHTVNEFGYTVLITLAIIWLWPKLKTPDE